MNAIEVRGVVRTYRRTSTRASRGEIRALDGVDLQVAQGELFGILGPNGAGKTTLVRVLTTTLLPQAGTARIMGYDVVTDTAAVRALVGTMFGGERGLYDRLSGWDNLRYAGELYGVPRRQLSGRIIEFLDLVGLTGRERDRVETYSRGMKQRLHLARALIHDPKVLFLDEPTVGLDPVGSRDIHGLITQLRARGVTILITTHLMTEAEALCDRLIVIRGGRVVAAGSPAEVRASAPAGRVVEVDVSALPPATVQLLRDHPGVISVQVSATAHLQRLRLQIAPTANHNVVAGLLDSHAVSSFRDVEPTLEDAYVSIVQQDGSRLARDTS